MKSRERSGPSRPADAPRSATRRARTPAAPTGRGAASEAIAPDPAPAAASSHRSLERGLAVLQAVAGATQPASLADTARRVGLHRSTAHHLLQALVRTGYLLQDEAGRGYSLGAKLFRLTGRTWSPEQIGEAARPLLEALTRATGEGSSVAVWHDGRVRIAAKQETAGPVRVVQDIDAHRPLHCTAVGKALAAWLPPAEVRAALGRAPMARFTAKTIVGREAFEDELRRIRAAGYAIDDEEQFEGLRCIAMPVFRYGDQVIASMCVVGSKHRMTHAKLQAVRVHLGAGARALSERLGQGVPDTAAR